MFKYLKIFIFLTLILLTNFACRKYEYPESTFKGDPSTPSNNPLYGSITKYNVNGIDSLNLLDVYIDTAYSISKVGRNFKIQIKECEISNLTMRGNYVDLGYGWGDRGMALISYTFSKDRKKVKINFMNNHIALDKNLFIDKDIWWQIIRLTPDQSPFKLKTTLDNGNTYEIQIR